MARPLTKEHLKRKHRIVFKVNDLEYGYLSSVAQRAGLKVNALARHSTLSKSKRIVIQRTLDADPALINHLQRIGVNLNQVARRVNQSGRVFHTLLPLCKELERIINEEINP